MCAISPVFFAVYKLDVVRTPFSLLAENGLIEYEEETHTFRTTEEGIHFLKLQNEIDEVAPISFISDK